MDFIRQYSLELIFGALAVMGGVARYLNSYVQGAPFSGSLFLASTMVSGFSGCMFALIGESMNLPETILFVMAGTGGFFGDQALKFAFEYVSTKATKS